MTTARHDRLAHRAWPTVSAKSLVLVPIGSTEQHGPHLPLNTDSVIAESVAGRAAEELSARLTPPPLVAPTLAYGASGEHAGFPGTVSLGHEALHAVIVETVRSLSLWAGRVVFVNGHGGNTATLDAALGALRAEGTPSPGPGAASREATRTPAGPRPRSCCISPLRRYGSSRPSPATPARWMS